MSCEDMDRLRIRSPQSSSSAWAEDARQHLASCARCAQLQASLDRPARVDFPDALQARIEAAILPGLTPVAPLPSVWRVTLTLLLAALAVIAAANWRLGVLGWYARNTMQASVDLTLLGISMLAIANILAYQMTPGSSRVAPSSFYIGAPLLALLAAEAALFSYRWSPDFVPLALSCWEIGVTCAALSAPLFWFVLRRGLPLNPVSYGAAAGLLAGLTGVIVLEIYCPNLDRLHISVGHIGAAITSTVVGAAVGAIKRRSADTTQ
jgi:Negative regulator of sigma F